MISRGVAILTAILLLAWGAQPAGAQPHGYGGGRGYPPAGFSGFRGPGRIAPPGGGFEFSGRPPAFRGGGWGRGGGYPSSYPGGYGQSRPPGPAYAGPRAPNSLDQGWREQQDEVRRAVREGRHVPLGAAIDAVRRKSPGRELDAGLEPGPGGRPVYRLRWAGQDGRRTDYMVDATTGRILGAVGGP